VYLCIVVASWETCVSRIAARSRQTGRDVPLHVVRQIFVQLRSAMPIYLDRHRELARAVLVYDNDGDTPDEIPPPEVLRGATPPELRERIDTALECSVEEEDATISQRRSVREYVRAESRKALESGEGRRRWRNIRDSIINWDESLLADALSGLDDGSMDEPSQERLVDIHLDNGARRGSG